MEPIMMDVPMELQSERLLLRAPRFGDGAVINAAVVESIDELAPWMPWATPTPKVEDTELWCRQAHVRFLSREQLHFSLWTKDGKTCVGGCGLHKLDWKVPSAEMGYWMRTSHAGKGLMTEAVRTLVKFGMEELKLGRIEIRCDERNVRSAKVAERAGFVREGLFRQDARGAKNELRNTMIYAKTKPTA
jgi:RimJ/RimL family protein N-acetyltransferase